MPRSRCVRFQERNLSLPHLGNSSLATALCFPPTSSEPLDQVRRCVVTTPDVELHGVLELTGDALLEGLGALIEQGRAFSLAQWEAIRHFREAFILSEITVTDGGVAGGILVDIRNKTFRNFDRYFCSRLYVDILF